MQIDADDFNLDARKEIRLAGDRLVAFLAPSRGGHLYELDVRGARRESAWHAQPPGRGLSRGRPPRGGHRSTIGRLGRQHPRRGPLQAARPRTKARLRQVAAQESRSTTSCSPGSTRPHSATATGRLGDFVLGVYESRLRRSPGRVEAVLVTRRARRRPHRLRLEKSIGAEAAAGGVGSNPLRFRFCRPGERFHFAVEFNFAGLAAGASDRYFYDANGRQLGQLDVFLTLKPDGADRPGRRVAGGRHFN